MLTMRSLLTAYIREPSRESEVDKRAERIEAG